MPHIQISNVVPRIAYTATAAQDTFVVPFAFFANADLTVYVDDVLKALGTDFSVTGAGVSAGGSITFGTPLTGGESVVIVRDVEISRTTDFPAAGPFNINSLNTQLDKLIAIQQQLENDIERTLRLADSDTTENFDIPAAASRANKFLAFDADGNPFVAVAVADQPASAFMLTLLDDATQAAAQTTLGLGTTDAVTHGSVTARGGTSGEELAGEQYSADATGALLRMRKSRHATPGSHTIVQAADALGTINFGGSDGSAFISAANIIAVVDGTPGANDMPGALVFFTTPDGSATATERMSIRANGDIEIPSRAAPLIKHAATGFTELSEISTPSNPAADKIRLFARDSGGVTVLSYVRSDGTLGTMAPTASQAIMEAGTSLDAHVPTGRQHFHPGHPKAGGNLNGTGTPAFRAGDVGMGAVTDNGAGDHTLALDTAFNDTNYWINGFSRDGNGAAVRASVLTAPDGGTKTTSSFQIQTTQSDNNTLTDSAESGVTFWGDYA